MLFTDILAMCRAKVHAFERMSFAVTASVDHLSTAWPAEAVGALGYGPLDNRGLPTPTIRPPKNSMT